MVVSSLNCCNIVSHWIKLLRNRSATQILICTSFSTNDKNDILFTDPSRHHSSCWTCCRNQQWSTAPGWFGDSITIANVGVGGPSINGNARCKEASVIATIALPNRIQIQADTNLILYVNPGEAHVDSCFCRGTYVEECQSSWIQLFLWCLTYHHVVSFWSYHR